MALDSNRMNHKKTLRRVNQLLLNIDRNGHKDIGKPEPLKHDKQGYWSRRIDAMNRLVYLTL